MKRKLFALMAMVLCFGTVSFAQQVTGKVVDSQREPLIGVGVFMPGNTTVGTTTDFDGSYSLKAAPGDILEFSCIGYQTVRLEVPANGVLDVVLQDDAQLLDEVIVTGYGAVSKKNLTTAISKVSGDDVVKTGTTNMSQMLMGRAAGLQATMSSAQPGGGVSITIRGGGTPLYVVDGMIMPSSSLEGGDGGNAMPLAPSIDRSGLAGLNPDDIESIEVLKDASASIYGIAAANGVILITTKKGKAGKVRVSYDGSYTYVKNYPYLQQLSGPDYMKYANRFRLEQYLVNNKMGVYGPNEYDGGCVELFSASDIASAQTTDWVGYILKDGHINQHNVRIQGGNDIIQYVVSGNFNDQDGTVANNDYKRYTLRSNVSASLTKWWKLSTTFNYNNNSINNGTVGASSNGRGTQANGALGAAMAYPSYWSPWNEDGSYATLDLIPNAVSMLEITDHSDNEAVNLNFVSDFNIIKNMLSAKLQYGYNSELSVRNAYIPSTVYFDQQFRSRGMIRHNKQTHGTLEGMLIFTHKFGDLVNVDAAVGMGRYMTHADGLGVTYNDTNDIIQNYNISAATGPTVIDSYKTINEKRSQFARASFDFLDKYVVAATLRRDGTDKFFPQKKYSLFPSVSVAWKIFNEDFMKNITWINLLKLRGSYGVTGNDNLGTSLYGAYSANANHVMFSNNTVDYVPFYQTSADYPDVSWEKTIMKNVGLDFSVLRDRISGSFDYFWNDVTDRLGSANTNGLSALNTRPINGSHIRRFGWDATVNTVNAQGKDFTWTSVLTLSHYNAIWVERMPNFDFNNYQMRENEPVNARYYYEIDGILNNDLSNCPASQPESHRVPGTYIIKDQNGDGQITKEDIVMINSIPDLYWGFGNTFRYKNWDLDVFMYSQLGTYKTNNAWSWAGAGSLANLSGNACYLIENVYHSIDNPTGTRQGMGTSLILTPLPESVGTNAGYEDASFLRIRNITLGYNFSSKTLKSLGNLLTGLRIYVDTQNPFTFSKYGPLDPEVNTASGGKGFGGANYPMTRQFSLGVKANF